VLSGAVEASSPVFTELTLEWSVQCCCLEKIEVGKTIMKV